MGQIDHGTVDAVVVYDRDLKGSSGTRSETDRYMQLSMLHVDGEWLVDNVIDIASAQSPGGAGGSPATPSTTAASPGTTAAGGAGTAGG